MPEVFAVIRKSDENGPWTYQYEQDGSLETVVTGLASVNAALNSIRDRVAAESFASQIKKVELRISP